MSHRGGLGSALGQCRRCQEEDHKDTDVEEERQEMGADDPSVWLRDTAATAVQPLGRRVSLNLSGGRCGLTAYLYSLRVAQDKVVACGLDLIDSRKHVFADALQQANDLLDTHFFPQDGSAQLTNAYSSGPFGEPDWDDLLNTPAL